MFQADSGGKYRPQAISADERAIAHLVVNTRSALTFEMATSALFAGPRPPLRRGHCSDEIASGFPLIRWHLFEVGHWLRHQCHDEVVGGQVQGDGDASRSGNLSAKSPNPAWFPR